MKALFSILLCGLLTAATVPIAHNDIQQTGANTSETSITPANVSNLHKYGTWSTTGLIFSQPLFLPAAISGKDVLLVAAMDNKLIAFDANSPGTTIWSKTFGTPRSSYPTSSSNPIFYTVPLGMISTPYVDVSGGFIYICTEDSTPKYTAYKLNLSDGSTVWSRNIDNSSDFHVTGIGDGLSDCINTPTAGQLSICPAFNYIQRPGLVVTNGKLIICFGASDGPPWHGWVVSLNVSDGTTAGVFCTTPNGEGGSVWMPGAAPAVDASGNIYILTGNGNFDGITAFSQSVVKLSPTLSVLDSYTPTDWATLSAADADVSSGRFILIPGTTNGILSFKNYTVYRIINTACMGGLGGTGGGCSAPQTFVTNGSGVTGDSSGTYSGGLLMNSVYYVPTTTSDTGVGTPGSIYAYTYSGGTFTTSPVATNINTWAFPGPAQMAGSANGATNQIIWIVTGTTTTFDATTTGTLRALDTTLTELWNSGSGSNAIGLLTKYAAPTIANGKVFVSTQSNQIVGFQLSSGTTVTGQVTMSGQTVIH